MKEYRLIDADGKEYLSLFTVGATNVFIRIVGLKKIPTHNQRLVEV